jgi:RNA polymerase sigma-70 factor (ECF subfamily)
LGLAAAHDPVADLYARHHGWLSGWLRKKMGCADNAADLAQDTFVRILCRPLDWSQVREPRAFLSTVAHGLMVNQLRRQAMERAYLDALAAQPGQSSPCPESRALVVEALMEIDALLDGLPPKARLAFLLSQLEGLPYAQIAERLHVSLSMVKKYMLQAVTHCMRIERA